MTLESAISVVIPARNAEAFLRASLGSVLAQTVTPHEVLVVDDGSTDRTAEIASSFDPLVRCIRQPHGGVSTARNRGVLESTGELIAFLDADDIWLPHKLAVQLERLARDPKLVASFSAATMCDSRSGREWSRSITAGRDPTTSLLLDGNVIGSPSVSLIRKDAFNEAGGFDPNMAQGEDWDLWLRMSCFGRFDFVDEPLTRMLVHGGNASQDVGRAERDQVRALNKFYSKPGSRTFGEHRRRAYATTYLAAAGGHWHRGDRVACIRSLLRAVAVRPQSIGYAARFPVRRLRGAKQ